MKKGLIIKGADFSQNKISNTGETDWSESGTLKGQDGFSPIATVSKTGKTATITITDKNGTTTATVSDGEGQNIEVDNVPTENSNNAVKSGGVYEALQGKADVVTVNGKQDLITSNNKLDYSLLDNTPVIPDVNNSEIVITHDGVEVGRFSTNQATGKTIDVGNGVETVFTAGFLKKVLTCRMNKEVYLTSLFDPSPNMVKYNGLSDPGASSTNWCGYGAASTAGENTRIIIHNVNVDPWKGRKFTFTIAEGYEFAIASGTVTQSLSWTKPYPQTSDIPWNWHGHNDPVTITLGDMISIMIRNTSNTAINWNYFYAAMWELLTIEEVVDSITAAIPPRKLKDDRYVGYRVGVLGDSILAGASTKAYKTACDVLVSDYGIVPVPRCIAGSCIAPTSVDYSRDSSRFKNRIESNWQFTSQGYNGAENGANRPSDPFLGVIIFCVNDILMDKVALDKEPFIRETNLESGIQEMKVNTGALNSDSYVAALIELESVIKQGAGSPLNHFYLVGPYNCTWPGNYPMSTTGINPNGDTGEDYIRVQRQLSMIKGWSYLDLLSSQLNTFLPGISNDQLHPSQEGHQLLGDLLGQMLCGTILTQAAPIFNDNNNGGGGSSVVVDAYTKTESDAKYQTKAGMPVDTEDTQQANNTDFYVTDESGNAIAAFTNGHVRTEKFNSAEVYSKSQCDARYMPINGGLDSDPEFRNTIFSALDSCNQTIYSDVELSLDGYIDATTHEFVEVNEYYKCSGFVYVKGAHTIEYRTRSVGDSYHVCFYDKDKNSLPLLDFPIQNEGVEGIIDLSDPAYSDVYYIIMSAYVPGYPPYLRLRGNYNFENLVKSDDIDYIEGNNIFNYKKCIIGYEINNLGNLSTGAGSNAILSDWLIVPSGISTLYFKNLFVYDGGNNAHRFGCWYNADKELIGAIDLYTNTANTYKTVPANTKYLRFTVISSVYQSAPTENDYKNLMVSPLDIPYEPYQSNITAIQGKSVGGNDQINANKEDIDILKTNVQFTNKIVNAEVELSLNGYIDAATHEFVSSNDYRCSGFVFVKGLRYISYKTRSIGDSYHLCFYDKYKNSLPLLDFPIQNEGIQGTIDLTDPTYSEVYYIIMSAYPGGYPPFLKISGEYDITKAILEKDLDFKEGYNIFNLSGRSRGKGISPSTGFIQDDSTSICSNVMLLPDDRGRNGDLFLFNLPITTNSKRFAYYDESMNLIGSTHDIEANNTSAQISCPSSAKYFCFTLYRNESSLPDDSTISGDYGSTVVTFQYSMSEHQDYYRHVSKVKGLGICASSVAGLYTGKKWVVIGDSLTERNSRSTKFYYDYVKEWLGFDVVNMGVSGTGYKTRDDVVNPTTDGAFYQRATQVPVDTDVVTIFGSFNDITQGHTLGTPEDTGTTTICGCMKATIEAIYAINPAIKLGIIAPCPWKELNPSNSSAVAYVEALHDICMQNSIPFLNLFYESGLRPWIREVRDLVYNQDAQTDGDYHGTHPNAIGHEMIASKIREFLKTLI